MEGLLLVARLVLAGVLLVAALGKISDLGGSRRAMRDFGLPSSLAPLAAVGLPIVELVLGIGLLPLATARWAALGTALLMLAFIGGIAWNLRQGRTPDCHCFGQLHSSPAGPAIIVRNVMLTLLALFVVTIGWKDAGASLGAWLADRTDIELVLLVIGAVELVALGLLGWLVSRLMGQQGRLLDRIETLEAKVGITAEDIEAAAQGVGLPVGAIAPEFTLPDLGGEPTSLASLRAPGHPLILFFTNPVCEQCQQILAQVPAWQYRAGQHFDLVVVSRGSASANEEIAHEHGLSRVLLQDGREVNKSFGVDSTPSAVVVQADGTIGSPLAGGAHAVTDLVEGVLASRAFAASAAD